MQQNNSYDRISATRRRRRRNRRRKYYRLTLVATGLITAIIAACALQSIAISEGDKIKSDTESRPQITQTIQEEQTEQVEQAVMPTEESQKNDVGNENPTIETDYDYAKSVPKSDMVENSYFDDAVFIGDSRTEGLFLYADLSKAVSYTHKGLMVDTVFTKPVINKNGEKISVMDALRQTDFNKVYIMLGINEMGWPYPSVFVEKYGRIIDEIKEINPQAVIYVQEILPVTGSVSQTHKYVKNEKINEFNALIRQMAEEKEIYYIDTGNAVSDANGCLPEGAAIDGIHLKKSYCEKWLDYLKTHTVTETER